MKSGQNNTVQMFWVSLGSLFSFSFAIVSSMILSRYLSKNDYGTYKQVMYVYTTLLSVFTLGLPKTFSFFLPRLDISQAKSLVKKIIYLLFILGLVFSVLLYVFSSQIASFLKNQELDVALKVFSLVPLFILPTMGLDGILATYQKTKTLAIYTALTRLFQLFCVIIPILFMNGDYIQALIGFTISSFISLLFALYIIQNALKNKGTQPSEITYHEIFKFSLPLLYASLWGILISSADQFFISRYFGTKIFAEFSNGAMELPFIGMIVGASATVLSPIFSRMSHESLDPQKDIYPIWISVFEKTVKLVYPLIIYFWFFADVLMIVLYGQQYNNSSIYFRIKTIINFFTLIVYAPLIINIGKVKFYANVHMYVAFTLIILEYISIKIFNSPYSISIISLICQLGKTYILLTVVANFFNVKIYELFPNKLIIKIMLPSIIILFIEHYFLVEYFKINFLLILLISSIIYFVLFFIYSIYAKLDYFSIIQPLISKKK